MTDLLTLGEGAQRFKLANGETFGRFAKRHGIPIVRFGKKVVRVRSSDLERAITEHLDSDPERSVAAGHNSVRA